MSVPEISGPVLIVSVATVATFSFPTCTATAAGGVAGGGSFLHAAVTVASDAKATAASRPAVVLITRLAPICWSCRYLRLSILKRRRLGGAHLGTWELGVES